MTLPELPRDARARIDDLARDHAEWRPWLAVVEEAIRAALDPAWGEALGDLAASPEGPLLTGSELPVDPRAAGRLVKGLLELASESASPGARTLREASRARVLAPAALIEAAINQDEARLSEMAAGLGADARALAPVASLAAMPLLWACRARLEKRAVKAEGGYCPVCGAWPALAELRGLDRARRLRCGRCAVDVPISALVCVYCGERDHEKLGALVPELHGEARKVEVCRSCNGYVKTVATLSAIRPELLPLEDLATVDLDLVALERGYARPEHPAHPAHPAPPASSAHPAHPAHPAGALSVRVVERAPARRGLLGWFA